MGSTPFDLHRRAPEQKKKKGKGFGLKLPSISLGKVAFAGIGALAIGGYAAMNHYVVDSDEAIYAINFGKVAFEYDEGWKVPLTDTRVHFAWPFSDVAPFPFSKHAVVPLGGSFMGTVRGTMYDTPVQKLTFHVKDVARDAYMMRYGPYAFGTTAMEEVVRNDVHGLSGIIDAVSRDGKNVDGATQALLGDINNALWFVLKGKSVEEINANLNDPEFMRYLVDEIEELVDLIEIDDLVLGNVTKKTGVVTFTTADGFPVDIYATLGGKVTTLDTNAVQRVLGQYSLMQFRHGTLPNPIRDELVAELGIGLETVADRRAGGIDGWSAYSPSGNTASNPSRTLVVNLGNAEDQFYRMFINSGMIAFQRDLAAERVGAGDIDGAIKTLEGIVEYSDLFSGSEQTRREVVDARYTLGILYEDLALVAGFDGDAEAEYKNSREAATYFMDFLKTAPKDHAQYDAVVENLFLHYGRFIDFTQWDLISEDPEEPVVVQTPVAPEGQTPVSTPAPILLEARLVPEFTDSGCNGVTAVVVNTGDAASARARYYMFREGGKFVEGYLNTLEPGVGQEIRMNYDGPGTYHLRVEDVFDKNVGFGFSCTVPTAVP